MQASGTSSRRSIARNPRPQIIEYTNKQSSPTRDNASESQFSIENNKQMYSDAQVPLSFSRTSIRKGKSTLKSSNRSNEQFSRLRPNHIQDGEPDSNSLESAGIQKMPSKLNQSSSSKMNVQQNESKLSSIQNSAHNLNDSFIARNQIHQEKKQQA